MEGPQGRREVLGIDARVEASLHVDDVGEQCRDQPAFLAGRVQRGAARDAEPSLLGILCTTVRTDPHARSLRRRPPPISTSQNGGRLPARVTLRTRVARR